jgi:hypothetical protein
MNITQNFYDNLAPQYDKLFMDWQDTTREQADQWYCRSSFAKAIREAVRKGVDFYEVRGLMAK